MMSRIPLICLAYFSLTVGAFPQNKIEAGLTRELQTTPRVRVIVVTRPEPGKSNGGTSFSNASHYISNSLGAAASNIKAIGSLPVIVAEIAASAIDTLNSDPNIVLVAKDTPVPPTLFESVPLIGADKVHQEGFEGNGYSVAVLDTGIDYDHPALKDSIIGEACFSTPDSLQYQVRSLCPNGHEVSIVAKAARGCPADIEGCEHGTHVAGIIGGHQMHFETKSFSGVAPKAKVVAVQVFSEFTGPGVCGGRPKCVLSFTSDQLRALEWLYKQIDKYKIAAINMSLGSGYHDAACDSTSALTEIIERLKAKGVATIVAAGNDHFFDGVAEPACISSVVAVAAQNKAGQIDLKYSNRSPLVRFVAPGTDIVSTIPGGGYGKLSGTSMAAPHVAAAFAVMKSRYPTLSARQIETKLTTLGHPVDDPTTGTKFTALSVVDTATPTMTTPSSKPSATASSLDANPASVRPAEPPSAAGSYIVKSQKPSEEIKSNIQSSCRDHNCNVKQINEETYRIELSPKTPNGVLAPTAEEIQRTIGGNSRVYENKIFSPFR